jgi:hypothetical protein
MIGLAFDEVDEEIGILDGQGEELVVERLLGLQLLAERPARVAVHEYVQESAGPARRGERDNAVGLIAKRVRSRCLKICRRPRQAGVQDKEQIPGAEHFGVTLLAPPKSAGATTQSPANRKASPLMGGSGSASP